MSSRPAPEDPARMPYSRPDADGFDGIRASGHEARVEAKFGPRPDAIALRRTSLNVRRVARGNFFLITIGRVIAPSMSGLQK